MCHFLSVHLKVVVVVVAAPAVVADVVIVADALHFLRGGHVPE